MNKPTLSAPAELREQLRQQIIQLKPGNFESTALAVFRYQATYNPVYRMYLQYLNVRADEIQSSDRIPFLPIRFFKQHAILTGDPAIQVTFESSGTTGALTSRHYVADPALYDTVSQRIFEQLYGPLNQFHVLALLPSYLERNNSSLVYMVQRFIEKTGDSAASDLASGSSYSGFFLNNVDDLTARLKELAAQSAEKGAIQRKVLLIGVTFALLDWAESGADLSFLGGMPNLVVMETGGMKGRRHELLREEVHEILTSRLGVPAIHSEYGMTELLSQAYSTGGGVFRMAPTLRILLRDVNDPFHIYPATYRRAGGINVIDLANLDSCSFIETQDLGQYHDGINDAFQVIGRFDNSDIRGCNLMVV